MRFFIAFLFLVGLISVSRAQPAPTADEKSALAAVAKAGGKGEIDPKLDASARVVAKFEFATDASFIALKKHPQIGAVEAFDALKCTEKGLAALKDLPNLRRLSLSQSDMTPARVKAVAACKELRDLRLPGSGLSDAELAALKPLALLELLDLSENAQVSDKGMATVKSFERVRSLFLSKTAITDKGLMELKGLEGLRTFYLSGTKVTPGAVEKFIDEMPNLRAVRQ